MTARKFLQFALPILILAAGGLAFWLLANSKAAPETRIPEPVVPVVRSQTVELRDVTLTVSSQGTVQPRTQTELIAEVSGRVIWAAPTFAGGAFFDRGQTLLRIEQTDYKEALLSAEAIIAQARLRLERERAEAELARKEWADLGRGGDPPPLTSRTLQVAEAEAALAAAQASADRSRRNLDRTSIVAPYPAIVRTKLADFGDYVIQGRPVAVIYAVDYAEVRLPLPDDELAFVDLPLAYREAGKPASGPPVVLTADFGGRSYSWDARIVRTEGEIDPRSRMIHAVARVPNPNARSAGNRPPLSAGMFVQAELQGKQVEAVATLPRSALHSDDQVLVIDAESRLRFRSVQVLRIAGDRVMIAGGLQEGETVCVSPLAAVTDGMKIRLEGA